MLRKLVTPLSRWRRDLVLGCAAGLATGCPETEVEAPLPDCEAPAPPAEALLPAGDNGGLFVLPDGRKLSPAGVQVELGGFPADVARVGEYAVITNASRYDRTLVVVRVSDGAITDEVVRNDAFPGMAVDGSRVFAAGGNSGRVDAYDVGADGKLTAVASWEIGGFVAGLTLDAEGDLWAGRFLQRDMVEIDAASGEVLRTVPLAQSPYALAYHPATDEVWGASFGVRSLMFVDQTAGVEIEELEIGGNPSELLLSPDGQTMWVTLSNDDEVVALDAITHVEIDRVRLGGEVALDDEGQPFPGSSPSAMAYDAVNARLLVTRAADNAVDVLDAGTLALVGSIPTGWYPTALALLDDELVVTNGKGVGSGDTADGTFISDAMVGTVSIVKLDDAAFGGWTADVEANSEWTQDVYPFECEGNFPIPVLKGQESPIKHIVLVVRENKTYDSLLGDVAGTNGDPSLLGFPAETTPNLRALAATFVNHDNFYDTSESSVQGHLALTGVFVSEYMERAWIENYHGVSAFADDAATGRGTPGFGTVFTHLYRNGVEFQNYGEIVGAFDEVDGVSMGQFVDLNYPGVFFNLDVSDEEKAEYFRDRVEAGVLAPFTFMLLSRDHTYGASAGQPSPESMVADNDYATGLVVDTISHSEFWESSLVLVVEDDPQGEQDHVDGHRSILVAASPWVKRGHLSSVHTSYPSLYRTIFAILGVPPLSRHDALATPLWDIFTSKPDMTPFTAIPRQWPEEVLRPGQPGSEASECLDFSGPDRNPLMGDILFWYRRGYPPPGSLLAQGVTDCALLNRWTDDDEEEADAYDEAYEQLLAYLRAHPEIKVDARRPDPPAWRRALAAEDDD
jgi:DNA-binding beta-propeller fold protein YncE